MGTKSSFDLSKRLQLEQKLLEQVRTAGTAYRHASAEYRATWDRYADNPFHHPEAVTALHRLSDAERVAMENYSKAVEAFAALILHDRYPQG